VHDGRYLSHLERFAAAGGGRIEQDTVCSPKSWDVARLAAGAGCDAATRVVNGEDRNAFRLIRQPGHQALPDAAMGFCFLSNEAIAARVATDLLGVDRVLIVDWDVHHGNGTQQIFWEDPRGGFFSIHRFPFYPGSGDEDETGGGGGLGTTRNVPICYGTPPAEFIRRFRTQLESFADQIRPQLVFISAGFDAHRDDPVGSLDLDTEDFRVLTEIVIEIARTHANGRIVSVLEGGYNTSALAGCVEMHLAALGAR
jgi:acetoin utilization deacetylase AcuC-like enzyme